MPASSTQPPASQPALRRSNSNAAALDQATSDMSPMRNYPGPTPNQTLPPEDVSSNPRTPRHDPLRFEGDGIGPTAARARREAEGPANEAARHAADTRARADALARSPLGLHPNEAMACAEDMNAAMQRGERRTEADLNDCVSDRVDENRVREMREGNEQADLAARSGAANGLSDAQAAERNVHPCDTLRNPTGRTPWEREGAAEACHAGDPTERANASMSPERREAAAAADHLANAGPMMTLAMNGQVARNLILDDPVTSADVNNLHRNVAATDGMLDALGSTAEARNVGVATHGTAVRGSENHRPSTVVGTPGSDPNPSPVLPAPAVREMPPSTGPLSPAEQRARQLQHARRR